MATLLDPEDGSKLFLDDDEETLALLASNSFPYDLDWPSRLENLANRFLDDVGTLSNSDWMKLVQLAQSKGFQITNSGEISKRPSGLLKELPSLFDSDDGKLHLQATAAALGVSQQKAAELTLSALRTSAERDPDISELLGSRILCMDVVEHAYRQKVARIDVIAELLRLEQDDSSSSAEVATRTLDILDGAFTQNGEKRGLFRSLISLATQADIEFTRNQLLPANDLRETFLPHTQSSWESFVAACMASKKNFVQRERLQSIEALVPLLYQRISGGVQRVDLALLLLACRSIKALSGIDERLSALYVDAMALWRINEGSSYQETSWQTNHPLLAGLDSKSPSVEAEINSIESILLEDLSGPAESVAMLAFGVLLGCLVEYANLRNQGRGWVDRANDRHAFDMFYRAMSTLVEAPTRLVSDPTDGSYDHLYMYDDAPLDLIGAYSAELGSSSLAYASIGRELFAATILAFKDSIISLDNPTVEENLSMLAGLVGVIFHNSPTLCATFWEDWSMYTSPQFSASSATLPFCLVFEAAYQAAASALAEIPPESGIRFVQGVSPLLKMASSLVYNNKVTEYVLTSVFHPDLIRFVLIAASTDPLSASHTLDDLWMLARVGRSRQCLELFRRALEGDGLARMVSLLTISSVATPVLMILSELLNEAPSMWVLSILPALRSLRKPYRDADEAMAATLVVKNLTRRTGDILRSECSRDDQKSFLSFIFLAVQHSCGLVVESVSALMSTNAKPSSCYVLASVAMCAIANTLEATMQERTASIDIEWLRVDCKALQSLLVGILGTSTGTAVMYYATSVFGYGLLYLLDGVEHRLNPLRTHPVALDVIHDSAMKLEFDPGALRMKGWIDSDGTDIVRGSIVAFRVLQLWEQAAQALTDKREATQVVSPSHLLAATATFPSVRLVTDGWGLEEISNFSLIGRFLCLGDEFDLPLVLTLAAYDLLYLGVKQARGTGRDLNGKARQSASLTLLRLNSPLRVALGKSLENITDAQNRTLSVGLRSARLLSAYLDTGAVSSKTLVDWGPKFVTLARMVGNTAQELPGNLEDYEDQRIVDKLMAVCGALQVLLPLWTLGTANFDQKDSVVGGMVTTVESETSLLKSLFSLLERTSSTITNASLETIQRAQSQLRYLNVLASLSLQILSIELVCKDENQAITRDVQRFLGYDLSGFAVFSKAFSEVLSFRESSSLTKKSVLEDTVIVDSQLRNDGPFRGGILESELDRISSWTSFASCIISIRQNESTIQSLNAPKFAPMILGEILRSLQQNLDAAQKTRPFANYVVAASRFATSLTLQLSAIIGSGSFSTSRERISILVSLTDCGRKLLSFCHDILAYFVLKQLLDSASHLLWSDSGASSHELDVIRHSVAGLASEAVAHAAKDQDRLSTAHFVELFSSSLSLLTILSGSHGQSLPKLVQPLQEFQVVQMIVKCLISSKGVPDGRVLCTALNFFTILAVSGDQSLLQLLLREIPAVLAVISSMCGRNDETPQHGFDDTQRENWRAGIRLLSASLRASNVHSFGLATSSILVNLALDFVSANQIALVSRLTVCCAPGADASELFDAAAMLSLVAEFCGPANIDKFKSKYPAIVESMCELAKSLLRTSSRVLGALAKARELFNGLSEVEASMVGPAHTVFSIGGAPNAKHEAIRFSTFVSKAFPSNPHKRRRAVSTENWIPESPVEPKSLSALERSCRAAVSGEFAIELEQAAAECLYGSLLVLWRTHPARSSFVQFSKNEAEQLDSLALVKIGAVIAFRPVVSNYSEGIEYGEVLSTNTVQRVWHVRPLEGQEMKCDVSARQLAGVEDLTQRRVVLSYAPAPETAADLESSVGSASVGHLVLGLRWASQAFPQEGMSVITRRLAELLAALLGTELSVHRAIGSHASLRGHVTSAIALQVLELFGDSTEVNSRLYGQLQSRRTVKPAIGRDTWDSVRKQLRPELECAIKELEQQCSDTRLPTASVVGINRQGSNAFRGLGSSL